MCIFIFYLGIFSLIFCAMLRGSGSTSSNDVTVDVQLFVCTVCATCKPVSAKVSMFALVNESRKCVFSSPGL